MARLARAGLEGERLPEGSTDWNALFASGRVDPDALNRALVAYREEGMAEGDALARAIGTPEERAANLQAGAAAGGVRDPSGLTKGLLKKAIQDLAGAVDPATGTRRPFVTRSEGGAFKAGRNEPPNPAGKKNAWEYVDKNGRSQWLSTPYEVLFAKQLDANPDVAYWMQSSPEAVLETNVRHGGEPKVFTPDFIIVGTDGRIQVVEIKNIGLVPAGRLAGAGEAARGRGVLQLQGRGLLDLRGGPAGPGGREGGHPGGLPAGRQRPDGRGQRLLRGERGGRQGRPLRPRGVPRGTGPAPARGRGRLGVGGVGLPLRATTRRPRRSTTNCWPPSGGPPGRGGWSGDGSGAPTGARRRSRPTSAARSSPPGRAGSTPPRAGGGRPYEGAYPIPPEQGGYAPRWTPHRAYAEFNERQRRKGAPAIAVDAVRAYPQMLRQVEPIRGHWAAQVADGQHGLTVDPLSGQVGVPGRYAVSIAPGAGLAVKGRPEDIHPDRLAMWMAEMAPTLRLIPNARVGFWYDSKKDTTFVDLSIGLNDRKQAEALGLKMSQYAIFNSVTKKDIDLVHPGYAPGTVPAPPSRQEQANALIQFGRQRRRSQPGRAGAPGAGAGAVPGGTAGAAGAAGGRGARGLGRGVAGAAEAGRGGPAGPVGAGLGGLEQGGVGPEAPPPSGRTLPPSPTPEPQTALPPIPASAVPADPQATPPPPAAPLARRPV